MKNSLKVSAISMSFEIIFSDKTSLLFFLNVFSTKVILDLDFILSVNKGFTFLQNILLSVISDVFKLLKKFFFSCLIKLTQKLRCLL